MGIFQAQVRRRGFEIDPSVTSMQVAASIGQLTTQEQRAALNGSVGEHACRHAIFHLNRSQIQMIRDAEEGEEPIPSVSLGMVDIEYGMSQVPVITADSSAHDSRFATPAKSGLRFVQA